MNFEYKCKYDYDHSYVASSVHSDNKLQQLRIFKQESGHGFRAFDFLRNICLVSDQQIIWK